MILVTGGSGFIGGALCKRLSEMGLATRVPLRKKQKKVVLDGGDSTSRVWIDDVGPSTNWSKALEDVDIVVHCAGTTPELAKRMSKTQVNEVNVDGTANLLTQCNNAGVSRFIYVSSANVVFDHKVDNYIASKRSAERLLDIAMTVLQIDIVIIRPPPVYGLGMKGNFGTLMKAIRYRIPLPFARIVSQRYYIHIDNLVDFLTLSLTNRRVVGKAIFVSDGVPVSASVLVQKLGNALGIPVVLFGIPEIFLKVLMISVGFGHQYYSLVQTEEIVSDNVLKEINWAPVVTMDQGLTRMMKP